MTDEQVISLKEYLDTLIDAQCKKLDLLCKTIDARFESVEARLSTAIVERDKALSTAKNELDRRLESMNEFRDQLSQQAMTFVTLAEYKARVEKYDKDVEFLRGFVSKAEGAATQKSVYVAWAFSLVGILIAIVGIVIALAMH